MVTNNFYKILLKYNVQVNGKKALIHGYRLGDIRYVEYSIALSVFYNRGPDDLILDIGCGHSILPLIFKLKTNVVVIDINPKALKWQITKAKNTSGKGSLHAILASANRLPFKVGVFSGIMSISTIEHLPLYVDMEACTEVGRVLRTNGECLITTSASKRNKTIIKTNWTVGIPILWVKTLGRILPTIFRKMDIGDRGNSYLERFYSVEDVQKLIRSSNCQLMKLVVIKRNGILGMLVQLAREIFLPYALIAALEYFCAKTFSVSKNLKNAIAFVMILRKY